MKLAMTLENVPEFAPDAVEEALRDAMPRIVNLIYAEAKKNLGAASKSGATLAQLRTRLKLSVPKPSGEVGVYGRRAFIGRLLETGAKAHRIEPRDRPLLVFRLGGRLIRTRIVRHPGFVGRHWLSEAAHAALADVEQEVVTSLEKMGSATTTVTAGASGRT